MSDHLGEPKTSSHHRGPFSAGMAKPGLAAAGSVRGTAYCPLANKQALQGAHTCNTLEQCMCSMDGAQGRRQGRGQRVGTEVRDRDEGQG
jgi:hypothetical protein